MISLGNLFILYGLILLVTVGCIVGVIAVAYLLYRFVCFLIKKIEELLWMHST